MSDQAAPGWYPDPSGEHEQRFWDGAAWTDKVAESGIQSASGWYPDPSGEHGLRYWDGSTWTNRVASGGKAIDGSTGRSVWAGRWKWLAKAGGVMFLGSLFLAFAAAFSAQDGTDGETKTAMYDFFVRIASVAVWVALVGVIGYAFVRIRHLVGSRG